MAVRHKWLDVALILSPVLPIPWFPLPGNWSSHYCAVHCSYMHGSSRQVCFFILPISDSDWYLTLRFFLALADHVLLTMYRTSLISRHQKNYRSSLNSVRSLHMKNFEVGPNITTWFLNLWYTADWYADKKGIKWFVPSVNQHFSKITTEDWYKTPSNTILNEGAHPATNSNTGINLALGDAVETCVFFLL